MKKYRGFIIQEDSLQFGKDKFEFTHEDYDDPEDNRRGNGETVEDCEQQINDMIDEAEDSVRVCAECDSMAEIQVKGEVDVCPDCLTIEGETRYVSTFEYEQL